MPQLVQPNSVIPLALVCLLGALANLLYLERYASRLAAQSLAHSIATHAATRLTVAVLGGLCLFASMMLLKRLEAARQTAGAWRAAFLGGAFAVGALWCSFTIFFALMSFTLALWTAWQGHAPGTLSRFLYLCLEISTYGASIILRNIPIQFGLGMLCGALISRFRSADAQPERVDASQASRANIALGLAVGGVVLFFVPIAGAVLSGASLAWGIKALRDKRDPRPRVRARAIAALVLSSLCILYFLLGVLVFYGSWLNTCGGIRSSALRPDLLPQYLRFS